MKNQVLFIRVYSFSWYLILYGTAIANTSDSTDFISKLKIFDKNGIQVPFTTEELEQFIKFEPAEKATITTMANYRKYNFGPMTFAYGFYVGPGSNRIAFLNSFDFITNVSGKNEN
jgi:hypothetical protein